MGFKLFNLCFALLAVAVSASSICKCGLEEKTLQDSTGADTVEKFKLKMKTEDGKDYDEEIEIDTKKETETYHVPKTSPDIKESDVILDFKKNFMMIRLPEAKSCFLSKSTENFPKPADLRRLLDTASKDGAMMAKNQTEEKFEVVSIFNDRSSLSDEMAQLCAKLPIYLVVKVDKAPTEKPMETIDRAPAKRTKRRCTGRWCVYMTNWICHKTVICVKKYNTKVTVQIKVCRKQTRISCGPCGPNVPVP